MLKLKCNCGKNLAPGETKCGLCAMGLSPARQVDLSANYQTTERVHARQDSGLNCPRCLARLSFAEASGSNCSYCHAALTLKAAPHIPLRQSHFTEREEQLRATVKIWPDKAPLR